MAAPQDQIQLTISLPRAQLAFVRKLIGRLGLAEVKAGPSTAPKATATTKKPRTQFQQDLVDSYKEAMAHHRGEIELRTMDEFLKELKEEGERLYGQKV